MKIGVAITSTPDRADILKTTLDQWNKYLPEGAALVVSTGYEKSPVAVMKNLCLRELEKRGVTHYFLADNDCYPIDKDWYKPFIESSENHLLYNFPLKGKPKGDMQELYRDDKIVAYTHTRGCFIYVTQKVLDTVGGFDTRFYNALEHPDYSNRIHNAGLTTYRSMSPINAPDLLYCLDQDGTIESSIKDAKPDYALYRQQRKSKDWMPYK